MLEVDGTSIGAVETAEGAGRFAHGLDIRLCKASSTSPVYFGWRNRNLLAHGAKEGLIYLMDADKLGGGDHQTTLYTSPRFGTTARRAARAWESGDFTLLDPVVIANGVVFGLATGENAVQRGGEANRFKNTQPAVLKALDATTGKELYNSGGAFATWVHFSGLAVSNGKVFAVDHDSTVYCFGLAAK